MLAAATYVIDGLPAQCNDPTVITNWHWRATPMPKGYPFENHKSIISQHFPVSSVNLQFSNFYDKIKITFNICTNMPIIWLTRLKACNYARYPKMPSKHNDKTTAASGKTKRISHYPPSQIAVTLSFLPFCIVLLPPICTLAFWSKVPQPLIYMAFHAGGSHKKHLLTEAQRTQREEKNALLCALCASVRIAL